MGMRCKVEKEEFIWENRGRVIYFPASARLGKVEFAFINGEMRRLHRNRDAKNSFSLSNDWNLPEHLEGEAVELVEENDPIAKQPRYRTLERVCPECGKHIQEEVRGPYDELVIGSCPCGHTHYTEHGI